MRPAPAPLSRIVFAPPLSRRVGRRSANFAGTAKRNALPQARHRFIGITPTPASQHDDAASECEQLTGQSAMACWQQPLASSPLTPRSVKAGSLAAVAINDNATPAQFLAACVGARR